VSTLCLLLRLSPPSSPCFSCCHVD
jgi:hypothetical protein